MLLTTRDTDEVITPAIERRILDFYCAGLARRGVPAALDAAGIHEQLSHVRFATRAQDDRTLRDVRARRQERLLVSTFRMRSHRRGGCWLRCAPSFLNFARR